MSMIILSFWMTLNKDTEWVNVNDATLHDKILKMLIFFAKFVTMLKMHLEN